MTSDHYLKTFEQKWDTTKKWDTRKQLQGKENLKKDMIILEEVQDVEKIRKKCLKH